MALCCSIKVSVYWLEIYSTSYVLHSIVSNPIETKPIHSIQYIYMYMRLYIRLSSSFPFRTTCKWDNFCMRNQTNEQWMLFGQDSKQYTRYISVGNRYSLLSKKLLIIIYLFIEFDSLYHYHYHFDVWLGKLIIQKKNTNVKKKYHK